MKTIVLAGALFAMLGSVAMATDPMPLTGGSPVTDAQKAAFSKICLKNSGGNSTLCTCKVAQLGKLIDAQFMDLVLGAMNGKTLPVEDSHNYAVYISGSNKVCAPGM